MKITRKQEMIFGVLAVLAGLFVFVMNWMSAVYSNEFYASMTILAPVCAAFGLCLLLIPYPRKEYFPQAEYAPKSWAFLLIPAIILGVLNYLYFIGVI